jgi:hypothetical protein
MLGLGFGVDTSRAVVRTFHLESGTRRFCALGNGEMGGLNYAQESSSEAVLLARCTLL